MVFNLIRQATQSGEARPVAAPPREARRAPSAFLSEIESAGVGLFWATNSKGELTYISEQAAASLSVSGKQLLGLPITSIFGDPLLEDDGNSARSFNLKLRSHAKISDQVVQIALD